MAIAGLVAASWLALWVWGASPYGRYLRHDYEPAPGVGWAATLAIFFGGWLLMSTAMMLPTASQLLRDFDGAVARRPERLRLDAVVVAGFLATWLLTGYVFRVFDVGVHAVVDSVGWVSERPQLVGGSVLVGAGLFELSAFKRRCLTACRSPRSFVYRYWRGGRPGADAFRVGLAYGASCVGCCWALMLVLFALGTVNLAWMLGLAAVMAIEKTTPYGDAIAVPVGFGLVAGGVAMTLG